MLVAWKYPPIQCASCGASLNSEALCHRHSLQLACAMLHSKHVSKSRILHPRPQTQADAHSARACATSQFGPAHGCQATCMRLYALMVTICLHAASALPTPAVALSGACEACLVSADLSTHLCCPDLPQAVSCTCARGPACVPLPMTSTPASGAGDSAGRHTEGKAAAVRRREPRGVQGELSFRRS